MQSSAQLTGDTNSSAAQSIPQIYIKMNTYSNY